MAVFVKSACVLLDLCCHKLKHKPLHNEVVLVPVDASLFLKFFWVAIFFATMLLSNSNAFAAVFNITATDVTTRALSVVWVSDEPVTSATIRVCQT